ncbi:Transcriptional regulator, TetR family [Pseudonocardia sp. Ae406_Ps2]|nr:Transcriptional regulator, TetR family [Pseudonocardia sp. Ae406_Ps2]OLM06607.1 Transcriptional regulator, TetR family [Pseudonocardia sp. Ae331_Ps2]OLM13361.1 Transcriptional regulator, TetR family [Pseudonocardia sp. Ae505_Ps2]OLM23163.1 Transcriptional regulator, TetR family [Pseudonocardia sp. Ae706_Ps2]
MTERTYFRHFADKREVLFDGETELRDIMAGAIRSAPGTPSPLDLVLEAYRAAIPLFVTGRPVAERRARVIATSAALQERAHAKSAALTSAVCVALTDRQIPEATALLASRVGAAVFGYAALAWEGAPELDLSALLEHAAEELSCLVGALKPASAPPAPP